MRKDFNFEAGVWLWPGEMGWHFVNVEKVMSEELRNKFPKSAMIKVEAQVLKVIDEKNNTVNFEKEKIIWSTSLFRSKKDNAYIMPIKKLIRQKADINVNEKLVLRIKVL